jgi:hypothetical protein
VEFTGGSGLAVAPRCGREAAAARLGEGSHEPRLAGPEAERRDCERGRTPRLVGLAAERCASEAADQDAPA